MSVPFTPAPFSDALLITRLIECLDLIDQGQMSDVVVSYAEIMLGGAVATTAIRARLVANQDLVARCLRCPAMPVRAGMLTVLAAARDETRPPGT